uniref:Cytochrome P450 n=1 Tax=Anopheles dirus TaxID=7168 RepID=A0A182NMT4_9DIPT
MVTVLLLGFGVLALYLYCKIKFKFAEKIPCVEPMHPVFGNGLEFAQKNSYEIFKSLSRAYKDNKRIFKLCFGPYPVICPTHPDLIQKIMTEPVSIDKPFVYDFMRVKHGLLTADYSEWRVHRKALNPTFNTRILNSFIPIFTDCVSKMITNMRKHDQDEKPINMLEFTSPCTLEMICRTSLGGKVLEREGKQEFIENLEIILHNVGLRMFNTNLYPEIVYTNTRFYRAEMDARKICYAFTDKIIHEKRAEFQAKLHRTLDSNNNSAKGDVNGNVVFADEEDDMLNYKKPQIFVNQLLTIPNDGKPFTHQEITDHIYTMIAAGNETSATQAAHALLLLAMHPEVQERAAAEVCELLADNVEYTHDILKEMVYLERVIKESQRLCPVAAVIGRKTTGTIQLDEFVIPKGYVLLMNVFALHRQRDFWGPNADNFDPDNFLPERIKERHPYCYLPFSGGPRGCIGNRYAMMSLKIILSQTLKNFKLTTEIPYEKLDFKFKSQASTNISPKVISLQQLLYKELQNLERSAFLTNATHTLTDESVFSQLGRVFHEFERQNQESVTAILRVLALVDHTLENTIEDCEKVFHLPSLESENILFRAVTRPLLIHVEMLCRQIASKDVNTLESAMEAVEREANIYRERLEETKQNMAIVLKDLDLKITDNSIQNKMNRLYDQIELVNSSIYGAIEAAAKSFVTQQRSISDAILQSRISEESEALFVVVSNFMLFLENETTLLAQDLTEQLNDWLNQTEAMIGMVIEEVKNVPLNLMETPTELFLRGESSLKCLAGFKNHKAMHEMWHGLGEMFQCFNISGDTERPFQMATHLLGSAAGDIAQTLQGIANCHKSTLHDDYNADDYGEIMSCLETSKSILEALQEFVESKLDEISFHIDISTYFNELKMETCVYYKAREMMLAVSRINHLYRKCSMEHGTVL